MTDQQRSKVTRKDRAIEDEGWIVNLLNRAPTGVLATSVDDQPYQSTLLFVYDQKAIYIHTARRGRVWENVDTNPRACFTVSEMGRLLPASTALEFSVEYNSVVVFGTLEKVEDAGEAERALQCLLDKYFPHLHPGRDYRPMTATELNATAVYRLAIEEWSGKRKAVGEEFPGAFRYGQASTD